MKHCWGVIAMMLLVFGSCKKEAIRDQEKELKRMEGVWNVDKREVLTYDTLGNLLSSSTSENLGTVEFVLSQDYSKTSTLAFNTVKFKPAAFPAMYNYFSSKNAGDFDGTNFFCQWEVDPEMKRFLFWAIGPLSNWHMTYELEMKGKGKRERVLRLTSATQVDSYFLSKD